MNKPPINDEIKKNIRWNDSDLRAYADRSAIELLRERARAREQIEKHVEEYLAAGGTIEQVPDGCSGYRPGSTAFVISSKNNNNAT